MIGAPVKTAAHMKRLEQMPPGEPLTTPELAKLWHVANPWPTLEYLLKHDLCKWQKRERRTVRGMFVYYRIPGGATAAEG